MTAPDRLDQEWRRWTPAATEVAYLNTGTAGPLLSPAARAMRLAADDEFTRGRIGPTSFEAFFALLSSARSALACLLGATSEDIALTHHTTEGMNIVIWGLGLRSGDRVVTTTLEHVGALAPLYLLRRRLGVELDFADVGTGDPEAALAALAAALERPAALVVVSHVPYGTGAVLPIEQIAALAHERGALLLVDGAQAVGALAVDLRGSGADFYAFPGQKWLCGPEGAGGLYVRREHLERLAPTWAGFLGLDHGSYRANDPDSLAPAAGAVRYETGSVYRPGLAGLRAAADWHSGPGAELGVCGRIHELAGHAWDAAAQLPGVRMLTPRHAHAGLISFTVDGLDPGPCVAHLAAHDVLIRSIPESGALRLSCGFYTTTADIDRALTLVAEFRKAGA